MEAKRYATYHLRWQASTVVMLGPMALFAAMGIGRYLSLVLVQIVGACIFWYVDKWIFSDE